MTTPATPAPLPAEAVTAAAGAIERKLLTEPPGHCMTWLEADEELARAALEAARPYLAAEFLTYTEQAITDHAGEVIGQAVASERERCAQLAALCDSILSHFTKGSDGYRARAGQIQIRKWETALLSLRDATDLTGATETEEYRREKWEDATT